MSEPTFFSRFVPRVLSYALERGANIEGLLRRFDLPKDAATRAEVDITMPAFRAFGGAASALLDEPFLGLRVATSMHARLGGTPEAYFANCANVFDLVEQFVRFQRLVSTATRFELLKDEREFGFEVHVPGDPLGTGRENCEWTVIRGVQGARSLSRTHVVPTRVWFPHEPPSNLTPLVDYFGTGNILFDQPRAGAMFDRQVGELRLVSASPAVVTVLERVVSAELAAIEPRVDLLTRVRAKVREELENGTPNLEAVARSVGMSDRTLQRRIRELGTSFAQIIEDERRELAIRWVKDTRMDLDVLASTLGYGQREAFWRAFKRWTGTSPVRFRKETSAVARET
jgi:AraC-like DNA-binding protein